MSEEAERIFAALDGPSPNYKRAEMEAAVAHREAVAPLVVAYLERVLAGAEAYATEDVDNVGLLYAIVLAMHFRETRAHDAVVALSRLPPPLGERLLGDFITEGLAGALVATSGGRTDGLRAVVADPAAYEYARAAAAHALVMSVPVHGADRAEVLAFLASFLDPERLAEEEYFASGIIDALLDLHPVEQREAIRTVLDAGVIDPFLLGEDYVDERLDAGPAAAAALLEQAVQAALPADVHAHLSRWACFRENARPHEWRNLPAPSREALQAAKAKRKSQRDARRKQRKKRRK
jgi:hypothetical protein